MVPEKTVLRLYGLIELSLNLCFTINYTQLGMVVATRDTTQNHVHSTQWEHIVLPQTCSNKSADIFFVILYVGLLENTKERLPVQFIYQVSYISKQRKKESEDFKF